MWRAVIDNMDLGRTAFSWMVALLIVVPAASVSALFILRAARGGWRLMRPQCPRCSHLQSLRNGGLPTTCSECGRELASGVPWVRPARTLKSSVGFGIAAFVLLVSAIVLSGLVYAVMTGPAFAWSRGFVDQQRALDGSEGEGALRAAMSELHVVALADETDDVRPTSRALLSAIRAGGADSALAMAARREGTRGSFLGVSRVTALLVERNALSIDEAEEILIAVDALPVVLSPSVGVVGGDHEIVP